MPIYQYTAKDLEGRVSKGTMEAMDESDLYQKVRAASKILIKSREIDDRERGEYKLRLPEVSEFSRQLGNMTGSGLTVVKTLSILMESDVKPKLRTVYETLHRNIHSGMTLSEAMHAGGQSFPRLFIDMIAAGEASGQLEGTAHKMAEHYDKEHKLNTKLRSAMIYPAILFFMTVLIVLVIFVKIMPVFFELFEGMDLPGVTKVMMAISHALINDWMFIIGGVLVLILLWRWLLTRHGVRLEVDRLKLSIPVMGKLLRTIYTARFARAMSSLYSSGLPLITTLQTASTLVGNVYIKEQFPEVIQDVKNGDSLSQSIGKIHGFDPKLVANIYVGEESGRLVHMLESVADNFDFEADTAATRLVGLLEPVMIVVMALIIGSVMFSVMMPIFSLYQNVQ